MNSKEGIKLYIAIATEPTNRTVKYVNKERVRGVNNKTTIQVSNN